MIDLLKLHPFETRWLNDPEPFRVWEAARGIGKTFTVALEVALQLIGAHFVDGSIVLNAMTAESWRIVSASERTGIEALREVRRWLAVLEDPSMLGRRLIDPHDDSATSLGTLVGTRAAVVAPHDSAVRGDPKRPNLWVDEAGVLTADLASAIMGAVVSLGGGRRSRLSITGSCLVSGTLLHTYAQTSAGVAFSKHRTSITDAIADGLPIDPVALREDLGLPAARWAAEFECVYLDGAGSVLKPAHLDRAGYRVSDLPTGERPRALGVDIAISGTGHRSSACMAVRDTAGVIWILPSTERSWRTTSWPEQESRLDVLMRGVGKAAIDASGLGHQFSQRAVDKYGVGTVEPVVFNVRTKSDLVESLMLGFERDVIRIPADDIELRSALLALRNTGFSKQTGELLYDAKSSTVHGHADAAMACALAVRAAGGVTSEPSQSRTWVSDGPVGACRRGFGIRGGLVGRMNAYEAGERKKHRSGWRG